MKATRALLFGVFTAIQGATLVMRDSLKEDEYSSLHHQGVDWLFLFGTVVVSGMAAQAVYYKWLWRWIRMKQNFRGTWSFDTTYGPSVLALDERAAEKVAELPGRSICKYPNLKRGTPGEVEIDQDPDGISFNQRTGEWEEGISSARHLAIDFDEALHIQLLAEITAYSSDNKGGFFKYIQSETITITEWKRKWWFLKKPCLMTGHFRTALMTDSELADARRHRPGWVPPVGTTVYRLIK